MPIEADPMLRRLQRNAIVACLAMAAAAYVLGHGRWAPVFGVLGGGLLIGISYRTIGSGVSGVVDLMARPRLAGEGDLRLQRSVGRWRSSSGGTLYSLFWRTL